MKLLFNDYTDERVLRLLSEKYKVPGFNYTLIKNGKAGKTRCFGVKCFGTSEIINEDTVFEAASLTKPLFALIVLRLVDRGVFNLDDKLTELAPELRVSDDPRLDDCTILHVLSHSTGLVNWGDRPHLPLLFDPGTSFSYSGEGFFWLQHVTEYLTGKELCQLFDEELLIPLGMTGSSAILTPEILKNESCKHDANGNPMPLRTEVDHSGIPEPNAAWSLYSGALDYAKFMEAILNHHGNISESLFRQMTSVQSKATEHVFWGLGWGLLAEDKNVLWHWGDNGGYRSFIAMDLETKDGLCIFCNGYNGTSLCIDFLKLMTGETYWDHAADFISNAE